MLKKIDGIAYVLGDDSIVYVYECGRVEFYPAAGRGWKKPKKQLVKAGDRYGEFFLYELDSKWKALEVLKTLDNIAVNRMLYLAQKKIREAQESEK